MIDGISKTILKDLKNILRRVNSESVHSLSPKVEIILLNNTLPPRFEPFVHNEEMDYVSHENTAVFLISTFQYCVLALTFSKGAPFRYHLRLFMINKE